jgi:hypothetical protein
MPGPGGVQCRFIGNHASRRSACFIPPQDHQRKCTLAGSWSGHRIARAWCRTRRLGAETHGSAQLTRVTISLLALGLLAVGGAFLLAPVEVHGFPAGVPVTCGGPYRVLTGDWLETSPLRRARPTP